MIHSVAYIHYHNFYNDSESTTDTKLPQENERNEGISNAENPFPFEGVRTRETGSVDCFQILQFHTTESDKSVGKTFWTWERNRIHFSLIELKDEAKWD